MTEVAQSSPGDLTVCFEDGTSYSGTHLVGCDGTRSQVRKILCGLRGSSHENCPLPVRFLGASAIYPAPVGHKMQKLDPFLFQGTDPVTDSFFFFSIQDTPANNTREDTDTYRCQIIVSWPFRPGFLGRSDALENPSSDEDRLGLMREITNGWASPFRDVVHEIPDGTPIQAIRLEDWPPEQHAWDNMNGRATLIGDAAHAMTMC